MAEQFDAIFKKGDSAATTTNTVDDAKLYKNHNQKTKISLIFGSTPQMILMKRRINFTIH
jgi:DNA polymerase-1